MDSQEFDSSTLAQKANKLKMAKWKLFTDSNSEHEVNQLYGESIKKFIFVRNDENQEFIFKNKDKFDITAKKYQNLLLSALSIAIELTNSKFKGLKFSETFSKFISDFSIFVQISDPSRYLHKSIIGKKIDFINPHPKNPTTADCIKYRTKFKHVGDIQAFVSRQIDKSNQGEGQMR